MSETKISTVAEKKNLSEELDAEIVLEDPRFHRDHKEGVDKAYELKSELVNQCYQKEIGFGRYQWELFLLSGFGWMADNIWLQGVAIILPQVSNEMHPPHIAFITLSLYVGLIVGATTWGIAADIIGRRLSWNITLFIAGVFGIAAGGSPNFVALGALVACLGFGIGGNLPVDGALYLECIPQSHQWTLTLLSAWWAFGQLVASLIAWAFIAKYSCDPSLTTVPGQCTRALNPGWRYTFFTLGALTFVMFLLRFVVFDLQESAKYLLAHGRDEDALAVLQHIAKRNGKKITLTIDSFRTVNQHVQHGNVHSQRPTLLQTLKRTFSNISFSHITPLFSTVRLAINTALIILIWGTVGLAYPLFNAFLPVYLSQRVTDASSSVDQTYRNYAIISIMGIPGSIIACVIVDWTRGGNTKFNFGGRKFAMAISTALTGVFLFLFTTSKTQSGVLGYSMASGLTQNAMYGVIYAYTPEVFPAPHRGTGDAICSAFNRITGLMAPIIATYAGISSNVPVFVSASLFLVTAVLMMLLPIETAGKAAL